MLKRLSLSLIIITLIASSSALADEGMWLPLLLKNKEADMKKNGMRISAEDIYSVNSSSLKDAIMIFGGGCTGEFVSDKGLLFTNHHCGYSNIVGLSTVENDYLTNGFWAYDISEELPCPGLSITQLIYMEDVTRKVLEGVKQGISEKERKDLVDKRIREITEEATQDNHYKAEVKPFYYGNQYFLYVSEVFNDIRLVGAPPSNIGKFGGDTDNWTWPRHTGDFAVFRVYANKDNKPAKYSEENIPYIPRKHLEIDIRDKEEGEFTFVFGYPGRTQQFLSSHAVSHIQNKENPTRIKLREERLKVYKAAMEESPKQRLRYSAQVAGIGNGWKKWMGEIKGLERLDAINTKQEFEKDFQTWAKYIGKKEYQNLVEGFEKTYSKKTKHDMAYVYLLEALLASDLMKNIREIHSLNQSIEISGKKDAESKIEMIIDKQKDYFSEDYHLHKKIDRDIFVSTMNIFYQDFAKDNYPLLRSRVERNFKGSSKDYFEYVYDKSMFSDEKKSIKALSKFNTKKISKDPAVELFDMVWTEVTDNDIPALNKINQDLDSLYRNYVRGIIEMTPGKEHYPDANFTLRVTYGNIKSYNPRDAVHYTAFTTMEGIMEKEDPDIYDYVVMPKLKELYQNKDYGEYKNKEGKLPVGFIASNHTTGGNSGSPVLNKDGKLIGINFDRTWEGTMSDIAYDPDQCRNISIDIRYCLFIIDKYANAQNIINELSIIR